jgi:hypothetical protein
VGALRRALIGEVASDDAGRRAIAPRPERSTSPEGEKGEQQAGAGEAQVQQVEASAAQQMTASKAFSACMESKKYTVKF